MHHYRCYRVWIWETTRERIADTLAWFPSKVTMPTASSTDAAVTAARDLIQALLTHRQQRLSHQQATVS
jgi:hypothetical protein